jgi:hypothetical protein
MDRTRDLEKAGQNRNQENTKLPRKKIAPERNQVDMDPTDRKRIRSNATVENSICCIQEEEEEEEEDVGEMEE